MNRRFKRILLILTIPILLGGILHYTLSYKIKNILELVVAQESDNTYAFRASKIEVSFWNKSFIVENAQFISLDSTKAKTHYTVEIPKMYLGIQSWGDILFKQKVAIDSLCFIDSKIKIHEKSFKQVKKKTNLDLKQVFKTFENILTFLEVKSFAIQNGCFYYKSIHAQKELSGEGINFSIRNLSQKNKEGHLLYTDDIIIDIKNQEWNMPDGIHTVSFSSLSFSGKEQFFELDSFTVKSIAHEDKGEVMLHAEKFFFNSVEFASMYENNALTIDTLLCIRPVLTLELNNSKDKIADTSKSIANYLPGLFKATHINYINIEDGQILLKKDTADNADALVQKSNLKIYNLSFEEKRVPFLKTDSILFGLKDIKFITPDNTFEIVASELLIINDDLVLRNSFFGPAQANTGGKSISFSAPEFRLNNINFVDLIQKKLNATQAELYYPNIVITSAKNTPHKADTSVATIEHFYSSLHAFKELVGVKRLLIIDGRIHIKNSDKQHTSVTMEGIHAQILPIHFVHSSALADIKYALPEIKIAKVLIESDEMHIDVKRFAFDGTNRKNYADYVHLNVKNEIDLEGNAIYWEFFDWDLFQKYKRIDINTFSAQKLSVKATGDQTKKPTKGPRKALPDIRVDKLNIEQLSVHSAMANDTLSFDATQVMIDSLRTNNRFFTWKKLDGFYKNIHIHKKQLTADIKLLKFNALTEVVIEHVSVHKEEAHTTIDLKIPSIIVLGNFYSTDFSRLNIQKFNIQKPVITYAGIANSNKKSAPKKAFTIPVDITAKELTVSNAQIHFKQIHASDTLSASGQCSMKLKNIVTSKTDDAVFLFDAFMIDVNQLQVNKNRLSLHIPDASIHFKNGTLKNTRNNALQLNSDLSIQWNDIDFSKGTAKNDGMLVLENVSGSFSKNKFTYTSDKAIEWQSVLNNLNIDQGAVNFSNDHSVFRVNEIKWQHASNILSLNTISYHPKLSLEDAIKHAPTQFDYLALTGKSIRIKNIHLNENSNDSIIHIQNILLDQVELSSTRDKNVPRKIVKLKAMPTKIIQAIPWPVAIDSVQVQNSKVVVHQIEANTYTKATIPIENIHATITNVTNRTDTKDSLYLSAHATIIDVAVKEFSYTESYADSLSYFRASSNIVPGKFVELNALTVPLAALSIDNGYSNKLTAAWVGNKYAAIGQMNFIYTDLEVHLLNKTDTSHTNIALILENKVAKEIIHKNNKKTSVIFFERNTEKQIFNYWLKATLQGVYSSVGLKSSDKYLKHYSKVKTKYHLPQNPSGK